MRIRYFVIDLEGNVRKASQIAIEEIWSGDRPVSNLGIPLPDELRLMSIVCDDSLRPVKFYLLRLDVENDRITDDARARAFAALHAAITLQGKDSNLISKPEVAYHFEGWPDGFLAQAAVALDIPVLAFEVFGAGGPLVLASQMNLSVHETLRYYDEQVGGSR